MEANGSSSEQKLRYTPYSDLHHVTSYVVDSMALWGGWGGGGNSMMSPEWLMGCGPVLLSGCHI